MVLCGLLWTKRLSEQLESCTGFSPATLLEAAGRGDCVRCNHSSRLHWSPLWSASSRNLGYPRAIELNTRPRALQEPRSCSSKCCRPAWWQEPRPTALSGSHVERLHRPGCWVCLNLGPSAECSTCLFCRPWVGKEGGKSTASCPPLWGSAWALTLQHSRPRAIQGPAHFWHPQKPDSHRLTVVGRYWYPPL